MENLDPLPLVMVVMATLITDIRSGVRMLVKYPTLSLVAVLTLGLGIGLSTTVFCVVNGAMFKGLPFPAANRIVALVSTNVSQRQPQRPMSVQDIAVFEERQTSFERLGAYGFAPVNLSTEEGRPERFGGGLLTLGAFEALGVQPVLGRGFRASDALAGAEPVMLIGHDLWQERYGGSAGIIGQGVRANGVVRSVIGVMPAEFAFPFRESIWLPLPIDPVAQPRGSGPSYAVSTRSARCSASSIARPGSTGCSAPSS